MSENKDIWWKIYKFCDGIDEGTVDKFTLNFISFVNIFIMFMITFTILILTVIICKLFGVDDITTRWFMLLPVKYYSNVGFVATGDRIRGLIPL